MIGQGPAELVLDVGNSRMKMALFRNGRAVAHAAALAGDRHAMERFVGNNAIHRITLGSVAAPDPSFTAFLRASAPLTEITGASPSPVRSLYPTPATFGVDRLANVAGAAAFLPARAVLAIDLGTCATYDLVDELAVHHGGIISPGLRMRAKAMHAYSARLPLVEPSAPTPLPGTDTAECLAAGTLHGLLMEVRGFIAHFRRQHRGLAVVLTGGDALLAARELKSGIFVHPLLTLIGLHALSHFHTAPGPAPHP